MEIIYTWIKNIVIYMIINTIIMNLLGNKSYKKYVSIVSGMILVLIVVSPLLKLFKLEENLEHYLQTNEFVIETSDFRNNLIKVEEDQLDAIFSDYEEKIKVQVKNLLMEELVRLDSFDIKVDQNVDSQTFGEIKRMIITASVVQAQSEESDRRLAIKNIEINPVIIGEDMQNTDEEMPSPLEITMKNKLSDFYNIEQGNIDISIQGG